MVPLCFFLLGLWTGLEPSTTAKSPEKKIVVTKRGEKGLLTGGGKAVNQFLALPDGDNVPIRQAGLTDLHIINLDTIARIQVLDVPGVIIVPELAMSGGKEPD